MLVMIDDVQFESKEKFFKYISKALGYEENEINGAGKLFEVLCKVQGATEVVFYDKDEIPQEMKNFADSIFAACLDATSSNENLTVSFDNTAV